MVSDTLYFRGGVRRRLNAVPLAGSPIPLPPPDDEPSDSPSASHHHKLRRMSSIVKSSYAILDSMTVRGAASDDIVIDQRRRLIIEDHDEMETEPLVSSLERSVQILRSRRKSSQGASARMSDEEALTALEDEAHESEKSCREASVEFLMIVLYLSIFSVLGESLRVFLGRLFGQECSIDAETPDSTTWLYSVVIKLNSCVTSDGAVPQPQPGGALFSDLPANMLGCFIMGLMQPAQDLSLLSNAPIAFLSTRHWFQYCPIVHLGLRTGFCGALTTLASWNTQMVAMISGSLVSGDTKTQTISALFGYVLGLEAALASLSFGQTVAIWLHRRGNPHLAREEDIVMFAYSKADAATAHTTGNIKRALPDYERRFLASLLPKEQHAWAKQNISALEDLERWKISTDEYRTAVEEVDDEVLTMLHEIEQKVLVEECETLPENMLSVAERCGWDVESLQKFAKDVHGTLNKSEVDEEKIESPSLVWTLIIPMTTAFGLVLLFGILAFKADSTGRYTARFYSASFAPFGTILRWKLSSLNGSLAGSKWEWLPVGTFMANLIASTCSAMTAGLSDSSLDFDQMTLHVLSATKTGFAGSLSTVSTFVVEGSMLQKSFPHHSKAHLYMAVTLVSNCIAGLIIYDSLARL